MIDSLLAVMGITAVVELAVAAGLLALVALWVRDSLFRRRYPMRARAAPPSRAPSAFGTIGGWGAKTV